MLSIKNLHAGYNGLKILNGIDLEVGNKEIVAVIGPNGSGKSTLIKSVFNIAKVIDGKVNFCGKNIRGLKTHELIKNGIVYLPQGRIIFGNLTVGENLKIGAEIIGKKAKIEKRINEIYDKFPILKERKNMHAFCLSGGERQILAIARALILKPRLLMLDEPSLGLFPRMQKEIFETIKKLKNEFGISILIVEQNAKKAIETSDRIYLLEDGKISLKGGKEILRKKKIKSVYLGGRY